MEFNAQRAIALSWEDVCSKVEKNRACNLLEEISNQRKDVSGKLCQQATGKTRNLEAAYLALLYWGLQASVVWAMDPTSCSCCS